MNSISQNQRQDIAKQFIASVHSLVIYDLKIVLSSIFVEESMYGMMTKLRWSYVDKDGNYFRIEDIDSVLFISLKANLPLEEYEKLVEQWDSSCHESAKIPRGNE